MRERDGVGDVRILLFICLTLIAVSDAQVARGYQPPPMSVDPSKVIFEDPREAYKVRTIVRDDASSNSLFHPPATEPEFNLSEKRKPFKELHPPSFQPPPQPRFQAVAPVRQMVNPPSSVTQHGQQWINTSGPQGPPPQFQQNRQLSNTAFGNQVPVQGPVAPPRRPETESQRQPIANNESFQRGQPPSFHPQNMPAHRSNSPPMFFNHNVPQKDWDELSQSSSRQPTFHQQVWQRPPAEFRRQVGSQNQIDPRREGPAQLVRPNPPKKPEEPVNIFIHLFLDAKNGTSKELHFNQPTQMNLPKGLGSVSNPIVIHKEIDRNSLEILRKKHQPSEPPANIVQVKAVVGSSDRRMDSTLEEAVDKELERTLPMVLEKMDSPNRSNTMDEDLRKGLEQALVDEISKHLGDTIDQVEQGGISSDDLEKIIEEGFDELEKEASSPMPTLPPLVIKTTTPMFDEESDGVFEEKPDMPMISHAPPVTPGEVTSQKTPAAEHPTLATSKTTEESEVPTTEPSTTERTTTRQTDRTRAPTTITTTEPPTTEATTRRTARTRAPTTKTTTEQPPATETTTKRTRAPTTKTTTEQPTTTEAATSPTLQTRPPTTETTTERAPSSDQTSYRSWTEESSTRPTTAVAHPSSNKLTALTKVEPATTPTTTATQTTTTEEETTATTIEEVPSTLGSTPEVIILKKPTKAPSATDFNEDMQRETVENSGQVTSAPSRGFPGTLNAATTGKEPRPTEAPPEQVPFSTDVTFEAPEETTPTAPVSTEGTASTVTSNPIEVFDKEPIRMGSTAEAPLWTTPPTARPTRPWTPARQPLSTTESETEPEGTGEEDSTNVFTSTPPPRQQTHHREPCPTPNDVSDRNRTDVVFLIDSSSSFDYQKFDKAIELVKNTVTQFKNIGPDGVQVSLVQYNLEPYLEFSLRRHNCRKWLLDDIADTEYMRGQSMLGKAIEKVNKFAFTRARGDREDADNVIVIVTDGMSDDRVQQPVQVARQNGARVLVIATLEANPNYLMDLAGHMDNLFVLGDGDANRPLANKLARKILRGQGSSAETSAESSSPAIPTKSEETDITVPPRPVTSSSWETPGQEEGGLGEPVTNKPVETPTQNRQPTVESTPQTTGEEYESQTTHTANRQPGHEETPPPFAGTNAFGDENKEPMVTVPIPPEVGFTGEGWPRQSTPSHRAPTPEENTTPFDNFSPFDHLTHPETNEPDLTPEQITPVTLDRKGIVALQCASDGFKIRLNLPSEYDGTVLVKGHGETSDCSQKIAHERSGGNRTFDFFVDNEKCGVSRMISASPRGHNSSVVINVMHNPEIITAEDRAYILQCFVAQPDDFELNTNLDVAPNQVMFGETISLSSVPPTCSYSIRKGGPEGTVTGRAVLGETIYHTWKCDGAQDANDVYGMKIHDCFASSDVERRYPIVDSTGCSADIGVLSDPTYDGDQLLAYAESKAFGFEEVESLKFVCKVSLCTRDGDGCEGVTPPRCGNSTDLLLSRKVRGEDIAVEEALTSALNTQVSVSSKSPSPLREGLATLVASKMAWALVAIALVAVIGTAVVARHVKTNQSMTDIESGYANSEDMSTSRSRVSTVSGANADPRMADFMRTFERDRYV